MILVKIFYKFIVFCLFICVDLISIVSVHLKGADIAVVRKIIPERDLFLNKNKDIHDLDDIKVNLNKDIEFIKKILSQNGFFDAVLDYKISKLKKYYDVVININTGARYKISKINFDIMLPRFENFFDDFINSDLCIAELSDKSEQLLDKLKEIGYKNVFFEEFSIEQKQKSKTVHVCIKTNLGDKKYFGNTIVIGNKKVNTDYIIERVTWKKGDIFNISIIKKFEKALLSTSLFKSVHVKFEDEGDDKEKIIVEVSEYGHHVIEFGGRFATSNNINYKKAGVKKLRGFSVYSSWTHLNLFGNGELLKFSAEGMPFYEKNKILEATSYIKVLPEYSFSVEFTNYVKKNNYLTSVIGKVFQVWTTRFVKKSSCIGVKFRNNDEQNKLKQSISCAFENYNLREFLIKNFSIKEMYKYINTEYIVDFDYRDNLLDATNGFRSVLSCAPCISLNKNPNILKLRCSNYYFFPLKNFVFVPWITVKTVLSHKSVDNKDIPCDKLLYSGGPNSLRGYYTNFAGDVSGHIPIGGKSVYEFGVEVRKKINQSFGACVFYEGAKISKRSWHIISGNLYSDFGFGVRYYSAIGPIRIDFAFPTKVRKFIDSKCQIIVALGQSF